MSQLFGMNEDNNIGIRVNDIKANNVYQKNEITGLYERVGAGGGGGPGELPYYLKSNSIDIDSGDNGSELSATGLTLGDNLGNETLDKTKIKILSNLKTNIITPAIGTHYSGRYLVSYNKNTDVFERASEFYFGDINANSYVGLNVHSLKNGNNIVSLNSVFLTFTNNSGSSSINYNHLVILNNLYNPALITPTASNKMIVFNPTTKIYNYANIPVGTTLPAYIQSNRIKFENDSSNYMEMQGNSYIKSVGNEGTNTFGTTIQNGKIVLNDYFDPFTTPTITLQNTGITYDDLLIGTTSILDKKLVDNIPKYYRFISPESTLGPSSDPKKWKVIDDPSQISTYTTYLPDFPIHRIGDIVALDMKFFSTNTSWSSKGVVFTAKVFEDIQYPSFEIKYYTTADYRTIYTLPNKSVSIINGSSTEYGTYIDLTPLNGNQINGFITIEVKEGKNFDHHAVVYSTTWPGSVIS